MTPDQIKIAKALARCSLRLGSFEKRFIKSVASMVERDPHHELTEKQDKYLRDLAFRYRRQMPLNLVIAQEQHGWNTLQWMAPELAKMGVLQNEEWVPRHAAQAVKLFQSKGMHTCAALLASLHPYALDYIRTAPVIVLAVSQGSKLHTAAERKRIASLWSPRFASGGKLRALMEQIELAYPLRKLAASVLGPSLWVTIHELSKLDPSTLSQVIPGKVVEQNTWLQNLHTWTDLLRRRFTRPGLHLEWAAWNLRPDRIHSDEANTHWPITEIADFVGTHADRFNPVWTFARAVQETRDWHVQLQRANEQEQFLLRYGKRWDEDVDYDPLPARLDVPNHIFLALRSGKTLFEEGLAMHHCVASYARDVIVGRARIYSIIDAKTGRRLATVELARHSTGWIPVQCKGPANAPVPKPVGNAVTAFLMHLNQDVDRQEAA